jgi:hypothetical protein
MSKEVSLQFSWSYLMTLKSCGVQISHSSDMCLVQVVTNLHLDQLLDPVRNKNVFVSLR